MSTPTNFYSEPVTSIRLKRLDKQLPVPTRAHRGDAGVDLYAAVDVELQPGHRALVPTGVAIALPLGTVGLVHPRSGRALKEGLSIVNAPGTIDADYRGELKVCLINLDPTTPIRIERGERIAQLVVQKVELFDFEEVEELDQTVRGDQGHGSTGVH
ncbi:dUTP diphosphatase [Corynebacterium felinum]|uniref:Deoxyuridine 5'-triphosphate nucleotidohydrolase n=1 Tax=Corynebacterium felinum TaxID=131318 RepID=A0ABU2BB23_9CORY|nr:dUTP diphosphatase [Corynebacterium felinum]MDF5821363.1 dUTP diphosphatase [Corynebacterium felinum]MDR7355839.1 dUTP pyrophosphatase [Corynebacterium felinum]WJY95183.1 Deoxyuridine 5'-triphosphate nucleotidohydrolase [Corynebacterium felinum]